MQDFDTVIRELIDDDTITLEDGLTFATNPNNLLLSLKGVTASEEFMQREGNSGQIGSSSSRGSMLSMIE
jgi:Tfp pilus assembly ATPase PilU